MKLGGELLTYIGHNITFTHVDIPRNINAHNTELQLKFIIKFNANYNMGEEHTQNLETLHPHNANLKLEFHKVASSHPHISTYTPQDIPPPPRHTQLITYADDITISET